MLSSSGFSTENDQSFRRWENFHTGRSALFSWLWRSNIPEFSQSVCLYGQILMVYEGCRIWCANNTNLLNQIWGRSSEKTKTAQLEREQYLSSKRTRYVFSLLTNQIGMIFNTNDMTLVLPLVLIGLILLSILVYKAFSFREKFSALYGAAIFMKGLTANHFLQLTKSLCAMFIFLTLHRGCRRSMALHHRCQYKRPFCWRSPPFRGQLPSSYAPPSPRLIAWCSRRTCPSFFPYCSFSTRSLIWM